MQTIGKYKVEKSTELDGGILCEAIDPANGRRVNIKYGTGLLREARNLAGLEHPCLPRVILQEEDAQAGAYWVSDAFPARSLKAKIEARDKVLPETALAWIGQMASTLDYLHSQGLVHSNVTPRNIWIGEDGSVQLGGLSLATRPNGPSANTPAVDSPAIEEYAATVGYQAPEFLMGDASTGRSDQFSLAAVAVECFTGEPAFGSGSTVATLYDTVFSPAKLDTMGRYPTGVLRVCERALSKSSASRFATCTEFTKALETALSGKAASETRAITASEMAAAQANIEAQSRSSQQPAAAAPSGRTYGLLAAGFAALLAIAGAVYWFTRPAPQSVVVQPAVVQPTAAQPTVTPPVEPSDPFKDAAKSIVEDVVPEAPKPAPKSERPPQPKKQPRPEKAPEKAAPLEFVPVPTRRN